MENYIKTIDTVVFLAYNNGFCTPRKDVWDDYAVKERLLMYGYTDEEGRYFLNEKGLGYVRNGCSQGINDRIRRQNEMERLEIEATQKAMDDAERAFIQSEKSLKESKRSNDIAKWAIGLSILSILVQIFGEQVRELFSKLFQLL